VNYFQTIFFCADYRGFVAPEKLFFYHGILVGDWVFFFLTNLLIADIQLITFSV